jgi:hypothetical protein
MAHSPTVMQDKLTTGELPHLDAERYRRRRAPWNDALVHVSRAKHLRYAQHRCSSVSSPRFKCKLWPDRFTGIPSTPHEIQELLLLKLRLFGGDVRTVEVAFIGNQPSELARFPSLFDSIKRCVVKKTVDVPVRIAEPANRSGIAMEELEYSSSPVLRSSCRPPLRTLHCISYSIARMVSSTADLAIFSTTLISRDGQEDAQRLPHSEQESRARHAMHLYTDSKVALKEAVMNVRWNAKSSSYTPR